MKIVIDKQKGYTVLGLIALVVLTVMAAPILQGTETTATTSTTLSAPTTTILEKDAPSNVKVELYHFHGTHQCSSCTTVGDLAEKTVNTYFKDELASGKIVFDHVNGELAQNRVLVQKYGVSGSSLFIGTYIDGVFHKEENTRVWYKINNEEDYLSYLKGVLDKRLAGDLS